MAFKIRNLLSLSKRLLVAYPEKTAPFINQRLLLCSQSLNSLKTASLFEAEDGDDLEDLRRKHRSEANSIHGSNRSFSEFGLMPQLVDRLKKLGYDQPFEIQNKTLELTLNGRNVIGRAITGSGKTLAFSLPIVQKIIDSYGGKRSNNPKAILISPTRELCNQIHKSIQELSRSVRCVALYGGASIRNQFMEIQKGVDVICATPGRLNDHLERGTFTLDELQFLCLDEADELLNPNFKDQIEGVLENSPDKKQIMLFSATMPADIIDIIQRFMPDPEYVDITSGQKYKAPESIKHGNIEIPRNLHLATLCTLLEKHQPERCIVFVRTKDQTKNTSDLIRRARIPNMKANAINSDLSQNRRETVIKQFRTGVFNVLCATDVAARGLDIPEVDLIIQVEPPANGADFYIHRSGRTGRAGRPGTSIVIHSTSKQEKNIMQEIESSVKLEQLPVPERTEEMLENLKSVASSHLLDYEMVNPFPEKKNFKKMGQYNPRSRFSYRRGSSQGYSYNQRNRYQDDFNPRGYNNMSNRYEDDYRPRKFHARRHEDDEW